MIHPCPVDCALSQWSTWGACSASCGVGDATPTRKRTRAELRPAAWGGVACPIKEDTETCSSFECPLDCVEKSWGAWEACSVTCGVGITVRVRGIEVNPAHGGRACRALAEQDSCNDGPCPIHCEVSDWTPWETCTKSCGGGKQSRTRTILTNPLHTGDQCPFLDDDRQCNVQPCPLSCEVSSWGGWHPTVGGGVILSRERQVTTSPLHGGAACPTLSEQDTELEQAWHKQCVKQHEKDVYYGWSVCTKTCGGGYQFRYRQHTMCSKQAALRYNAMFREGRHCNMQPCVAAITPATNLDEALVPSEWQPAYLRHTEGTWTTLKVGALAAEGLPVGHWQRFDAN